MDKKAHIFVICAPYISGILHREIKALGFTNTTEQPLGVQLTGSLADAMRLNLHLRTANKVLWQVGEFRAANPEQLYQQATKLPWEDEISLDGYFNIDSYVKNNTITDTRFANLRLKDAIVDRFSRLQGKRPESGPLKDKTRIYMHWRDTKCTLYYDTSGRVIAKHGYRKQPGQAPMLESLAAAVILTANWDRQTNFINPMCGSGTLAIEAALLATHTAPGLFRKNFGFMHLQSFNKKQWQIMTAGARSNIRPASARIMASDIDAKAIKVARANAREAGMEPYIQFTVSDFKKLSIPDGPGVVMLNPEYGERLGEAEGLKAVYKAIGDFFKQQCQGYWGYIFTGNRGLAKVIGLRSKRKVPFYNGNIECRLLEYELYSGSKKSKK